MRAINIITRNGESSVDCDAHFVPPAASVFGVARADGRLDVGRWTGRGRGGARVSQIGRISRSADRAKFKNAFAQYHRAGPRMRTDGRTVACRASLILHDGPKGDGRDGAACRRGETTGVTRKKKIRVARIPYARAHTHTRTRAHARTRTYNISYDSL